MSEYINKPLIDEQKAADVAEIICNNVDDMIKYYLSPEYLKNCIDETRNTEEEDNMSYSRIRVFLGNDINGRPIYSWVGGSTQDERNDNIVMEYFKSGRLWEVLSISRYAEVSPEAQNEAKHVFSDYAWEYFKRYKEPRLEANSRIRDISAINVLSKFFDGKFIEDITTADVQDFMNYRAQNGMSMTTISGNVKLLRQILASAVEDGICRTNAAASPRLTRVGRVTDGTQALPVDVFKQIIASLPEVEDRDVKLTLALLCLTGMRREEILGLKWEDVCFDTKQIHVQRAVTYPNGVAQVKAPKSKSGDRFIPIPDMLMDILNEYPHDDSFIVTGDTNAIHSDVTVRKLFNKIRAVTGLPDITAKSFRTTFATVMATNPNVTTDSLRKVMGHSKSQITMDVYVKTDKTKPGIDHNAIVDTVQTASET